MEVPVEEVMQRLVNRIAELEYQLAVAQAGLARYEKAQADATVPDDSSS